MKYYIYFPENIHVVIKTDKSRISERILERAAPLIAKQISKNPLEVLAQLKLRESEICRIERYEIIGDSVSITCRNGGVGVPMHRVVFVDLNI